MKVTTLTKIGLLVFSLTFVFSSCTKDGDDVYIDNPTQWTVKDFPVEQNMWKWDSADECYYYETNYSALTNDIAEDGAVLVSAFMTTFRPLPFTHYFYDENGGYLAETINYEYWAGGIRFNVTALDLFDNTPATYLPPKYLFKVTLIY